MYEFDLNKHAVTEWAENIAHFTQISKAIFGLLKQCSQLIGNYYQFLNVNYNIDKKKVYHSSVVTDIAKTIFTNIDAHGEIGSNSDENQISAYSFAQGVSVASSCELLKDYIISESGFKTLLTNIEKLVVVLESLEELLANDVNQVLAIIGMKREKHEYDAIVEELNNANRMNPHSIRSKDIAQVLSPDEKMMFELEDETMTALSDLILKSASTSEIVRYCLSRKKHHKKHVQDENSFFICKIAQGNAFTGDAPGALKVIPSPKPNVKFDDILGAGMSEVHEFYKAIENSQKWKNIFLATSPSKTADKSNMLLVCHF
jgi:hypothetical protein